MTSHPAPTNSKSPSEKNDSSAKSLNQNSATTGDSAAETTLAEPDIVPTSETKPPVIKQHVAAESVSARHTDLENPLEDVLKEFSRSLATEHQDLNQTLPETSLKPATGREKSGLDSPMQSGSLRPRNLQLTREFPAQGFTVDSSQDYVTLDKLGAGGMGTVYLARQVALGREVALKQIHQRSSQRQTVRDEFLTEAVLTGKLEHPNIVPIYEVGESQGGELFYAMKNVKGRAWNDTIDDLSLSENLEVLIDVCDAIAFAHAEGVLHRDLKPQNIMTGGFGEVLVLDWGLAVLTAPSEDTTASAGGTPSYMSPEMINPPFLVGPRSDVYLLGAILFRLLTGLAPHAGKTARNSLAAASKNEIVEPDVKRMHEQDPTGELLGVALKAMATDPATRYQTVREFQQAVREFDAHQESLTLTIRAEETLNAAEQSGNYTQYSEAVFGFGQAVTLWEGNVAAVEGVQHALKAYALCAERKADFELGLSLLDESVTEQQETIQRLIIARDERDARQGRLRRLNRWLAAAGVLIFGMVSAAAFWINQARLDKAMQLNQGRAEHLKTQGEFIEISITSTIGDLARDVRLLATRSGIQAAAVALISPPQLATAEEKTRLLSAERDMAVLFREFLDRNGSYMQVRYLANDVSGNERVRLDRNKQNGAPFEIKKSMLQGKKGTAYFDHTIDLAPGTFFLSDININRENGKRQWHFPAVRAAAPVFSPNGGQCLGIVVVNMHFGYVLKILERATADGIHVYLADRDGRFLAFTDHPDVPFCSYRGLDYSLEMLFKDGSSVPGNRVTIQLRETDINQTILISGRKAAPVDELMQGLGTSIPSETYSRLEILTTQYEANDAFDLRNPDATGNDARPMAVLSGTNWSPDNVASQIEEDLGGNYDVTLLPALDPSVGHTLFFRKIYFSDLTFDSDQVLSLLLVMPHERRLGHSLRQ